MREHRVIGMMSGTSLDGLDIASCIFKETDGRWSYTIEEAETIPYDHAFRKKLADAPNLSGFELALLSNEFGRMAGREATAFCKKYRLQPELVSSHGHTVFHQPGKGITLQIGNGAEIAAVTGIPTVCDFRSKDVAMGGQGAPLVPIGDRLLFGNYTACLNLGGFANISFDRDGKRLSFDICPVNIVLNQLSQAAGLEYDRNGELAQQGSINEPLLKELNALAYYEQPIPKSLGREWVEEHTSPLLRQYKLPANDALRTFCEHIAIQIAKTVPANGSLLVTGGGTHNSFLMELLQNAVPLETVVPDKRTIDFKEALIFAFLGLLRVLEKKNCLASVTGAKEDNIGGAVYL